MGFAKNLVWIASFFFFVYIFISILGAADMKIFGDGIYTEFGFLVFMVTLSLDVSFAFFK